MKLEPEDGQVILAKRNDWQQGEVWLCPGEMWFYGLDYLLAGSSDILRVKKTPQNSKLFHPL